MPREACAIVLILRIGDAEKSMRRFPTFLIVFLTALLFFSCLGCNIIQRAIYKSAIQKALHEDSLTGQDPTAGHAEAMRRVDLSGCPQDFRDAYLKHVHAWDEKVAVHQAKAELDDQAGADLTMGVLAGLFGSDATPIGDHVQKEQELDRLDDVADNDIEITWRNVQDVALQYGAH